ncbi:MAG: hypothetical protein FWF79_04210 [Defluviitaleaceae bacterium]|nr:hypothetical protein [Defluviitaleaceae bacterium]
MPQYRNVLSWLETEYLTPAIAITKQVVEGTDVDETAPDTGNYAELKDLEHLLEKALTYIRRHQH